MTADTIKLRQVRWAIVPGGIDTKTRPVVIVRIVRYPGGDEFESLREAKLEKNDEIFVEFVYATRTPNLGDEAQVRVCPPERSATKMGLTADSYFGTGSTGLQAPATLQGKMGMCPVELFVKIKKIAKLDRIRGYKRQVVDNAKARDRGEPAKDPPKSS